MKICQIHPYKAPARDSMGAERVVESLTKGLLKLGHQVVMKIHPESTNTPAPVVKEIPNDCDILHFHQWEPDKIDYEKYNKPWIVTIHGGGSETDPNWIKATANNPHVVCVSKYISGKVNAPANVWTCSDPDDFIFNDKKEDYFLWMAGTDWGEGKGLFTTIRMAKKLRFKLKIAGTGRNEENIKAIKILCDDKIEYIGSVNGKEKAEVLSKAKALILLTKLNDACPTTVSEAMLSGTPVIGSTFGAMPELIKPGVGFICDTEQDFAKAILSINKISPVDCFLYGMENLSSHAAAAKYLQYYKNMIELGKLL